MSSITLRPLLSSDAKAFMAWGGDPEVTQPLFWDHYTDLELAKKFLKDVAEKHPWFMAICLNELPVGAITLEKGKLRASVRAELGYVISKNFWNKGITSEAVKIALQRGFKDLDVKRIEAYVDPDNKGSIKVLQKNGFLLEGNLKKYVLHRGKIRDRLLYAITI
jgi:RimJ/RimL family protein N-acetyltransferase